MIKIVTVIGARPQFIKASAVSKVFSASDQVEEIIVHTGQHYDPNMSEIFFEEMHIPRPKYQLDVNGGDHGEMTGNMMIEIEKIVNDEEPDYVMIYGDTNSTLAGALVAKKKHVKVIHIEAGLRSFNLRMPEEVNRILTDRISDILCCPTDEAMNNLDKEGYEHFGAKVVKSGDVMQDASLNFAAIAKEKSTIIKDLGLNQFVLCTIHRAENTDDLSRLKSIILALNEVNKETAVVCPLHPRTKKIIGNLDIEAEFQIIDPVGYMDMLELITNSRLVMTDSGGLQKEAYFFERPCITMRDETEWVELIKVGANVIVGADQTKIIDAYHSMKDKKIVMESHMYGGGKASENILSTILEA